MKNISSLTHPELLKRTQELVREERRITILLIEHLHEIERRMLFAELGFSSLFEFAIKHLGLSEGAANRRIQAMRLIRDVPEAKSALSEGKLSLTNAAKIQVVAKKGALDRNEKQELVSQVSGLTQRECEMKLFELAPEAMAIASSEKERIVGKDATELRLVISDRLKEKLQRLKDLLAHSVPSGSMLDLLEHLANQELKRLEKKRGVALNPDSSTSNHSAAERTKRLRSDTDTGTGTLTGPVTEPDADAGIKPDTTTDADTATETDASPTHAAKIRTIWKRARARCEFPNCPSRHRLEVDHILPRALGGRNEATNLRILCRTHNVQQAKARLTPGTMERFIPKLR